MASKESKSIKCYYCGNIIESEKDLVEKRIPLRTKAGMRMYRRKLHLNCVPKIVKSFEYEKENQKEEADWDKCYALFRDLIGQSNSTLKNHAVMRIRGLRVGKYLPNGDNTKFLARGYSYDVIYKTMMLCSSTIRKTVNDMNFGSDERYLVDYCMKIITNNIDFIHRKTKQAEISNMLIDSHLDDYQEKPTADYVKKAGLSKAQKAVQKVNDQINKEDWESLFE